MSLLPAIVVRPEPGNAATVQAARALGIAAQGWPLFEVAAMAWDCPDPAGFDALLIASSNAIRHAGQQLAQLRGLPVHAVGAATAEAARAAGLAIASVGERDLAALLVTVPRPARLLRLCGAEHIALPSPAGLSLTTTVVYEVRSLPVPARLAERLADNALVLLHSAAAARHFAAECDRLALPRAHIALACLAPRVAAAAGEGWADLRSAARPSDGALLALARQMCQSGALGIRHGRDAHGG